MHEQPFILSLKLLKIRLRHYGLGSSTRPLFRGAGWRYRQHIRIVILYTNITFDLLLCILVHLSYTQVRRSNYSISRFFVMPSHILLTQESVAKVHPWPPIELNLVCVAHSVPVCEKLVPGVVGLAQSVREGRVGGWPRRPHVLVSGRKQTVHFLPHPLGAASLALTLLNVAIGELCPGIRNTHSER